MEHQRGHLERSNGDVERGVADVLVDEKIVIHSTPHLQPQWLLNWEARRPVWLMEMIAESVGVGIYVYVGVGSTAALLVTEAAGIQNFGSLYNIALGYGIAAALGLTIAAPTSGGQLSPGFSVALSIFKGFPARKIPQYMLAQIFGGFIAALCVYGAYKPSLDLVEAGMRAAGKENLIFSASGPAGVFALFPNVGTDLKYTFVNEVLANVALSLVVFSVIDSRNPFVGYTSAPLLIGLAYAAIIWSFATESVALNTARDLGGRFACGIIYGSKCFTTSKSYTALAALTNIPSVVLGGFIHTMFLSDSSKPIVSTPPAHPTEESLSMRVLTMEQDANLRALTRERGDMKKME